MSVLEAIPAIDNALSLVKRLREVGKKIEEAEFRNVLANLYIELSDAKTEIATLRLQVQELREEKAVLEARLSDAGEKPKLKWGCYQFGDDPNLYCPACYDTQGKKHLATRKSIRERVCSVCKGVLYS